MEIRKHLLSGDNVSYRETPNKSGEINSRNLVLENFQ